MLSFLFAQDVAQVDEGYIALRPINVYRINFRWPVLRWPSFSGFRWPLRGPGDDWDVCAAIHPLEMQLGGSVYRTAPSVKLASTVTWEPFTKTDQV
jgi:hypothetical protein